MVCCWFSDGKYTSRYLFFYYCYFLFYFNQSQNNFEIFKRLTRQGVRRKRTRHQSVYNSCTVCVIIYCEKKLIITTGRCFSLHWRKRVCYLWVQTLAYLFTYLLFKVAAPIRPHHRYCWSDRQFSPLLLTDYTRIIYTLYTVSYTHLTLPTKRIV